MIPQLFLGLASVIWGGLWAYATLLVFLMFLTDQGSLYAQPMKLALDRFVDMLRLGWLKALHNPDLPQRRVIGYGLFGLVTVGVGYLIWILES